jgi:hypothetical protein
VLAPPNPLRGLAHDAEFIASYVNQIDGPVLLVAALNDGHQMSEVLRSMSAPRAMVLWATIMIMTRRLVRQAIG